MNWKKTLPLLALLILAGLGIALFQTFHFFEIRTGANQFRSFCNIGQSMNCEAVEASAFAEILPGIPLSAVAFGWYLVFLAWTVFSWRSQEWAAMAPVGLLTFSTVGFAMSVGYLAIMAFVLRTYCLLCLAVDGINFSLFALVLWMRPWKGTPLLPLHPKLLKNLIAFGFGALAIAFLLSKITAGNRALSSTALNEFLESIHNSPTLDLGITSQPLAQGPSNAPVTIIKFSDFQCPHCQQGALFLHPALQLHQKNIQFIFKNFPLDPACNRMVQQNFHPFSCLAARGSLCAQKQGHFPEYYEKVFGHQNEISAQKLDEWVKELGMDLTAFKACVDSEETKAQLNADIEDGIRLNVRSTPTFFLNNRKFEGALPTEVWLEWIKSILAAKPQH